ncbi:YfjD family protein [Bacillus sp. F19]|nr:YfjD family protein [Bacillus sp. F19]
MPYTHEEPSFIKIRAPLLMYLWMGLFIFGGLTACYLLITYGLKFESDYSLIYLGGGLILSPFFIYEALWALPGFIPGKVLFILYKGENGSIVSKKKTVQFKNIRNINFKRNPLNLFNEVIVETYDNKSVKFKTYNLLHEVNFYDIVDEHIFPNMTDEVKIAWNRKISDDQFLKSMNYERKNHKAD